MRCQIRCHHIDSTLHGLKRCTWSWQTSGPAGAAMAARDHRNATGHMETQVTPIAQRRKAA
jgi:hypothetical protein